ncbi:hypothetical protein AM588_10001023 [Phytophthora nicotianae]|uniref:DUF659 domain-containing protein n=2 Tax=Phytophthora nicotianae TaxID=4792 RepID=A0A0W8CNV8_PHYNI|nr:hypothetical protein AM588_10001023 [Phytophthora nicotianae]
MPKQRYPIWELFVETQRREKGVRAHPVAECKACHAELKNAMPSENMLRHAINCTELGSEENARWKRHYDNLQQQKAKKLLEPSQQAADEQSYASLHLRSPSTVNKRLFDSPESARHSARKSPRLAAARRAARKNVVDKKKLRVAMAFYATGIPFRVVEDPFFRAMFDYELPSRRQLAGSLLDRTYERDKQLAIEALKGKGNLALVTDGWSNTSGDSIINFMFVNPRCPAVFWKSVCTAAEEHSGENIANAILSTIIELESFIGEGAVSAVVTDNARNMKKAWELVTKERNAIVARVVEHTE